MGEEITLREILLGEILLMGFRPFACLKCCRPWLGLPRLEVYPVLLRIHLLRSSIVSKDPLFKSAVLKVMLAGE